MAITGVLFDFSGTLFRIETVERWLRVTLDRLGIAVPEAELAHWAEQLARAGALPGGSSPHGVPERLAPLWEVRDCAAEHHRELFTGLAREAALPWPEAYEALYDRHMEPGAWTPYPDASEVLGALRERGTRIAVVSNIGWDLRPVFREHGLDGFVDAYVLSYEHGVAKPDERLFRAACEALDVTPRETLMVGDDVRADGGATAAGCALELVERLPVAERPHGLRPVLGRLG
ncbi:MULTISPECIES: HAD family hydrolase [Streptomyces]|uniref:HAD family hydrolase n=2 Tax=Streptomyces TaxID=1883 RepID=A0A3M8EXQ1_9ACTN|nr:MULTISPECIES: HAD-IA family hydrolase [Streptomyces]KNE81147.1 hydrolase [Streptomyces fradiae]OFA57799.1 hydrolase [Streptomyces fradiae]PQM23626.1 hydrolase [Streptomyces xinghaiensis]RKM92290.1 HAD family hydrolase [Streptomyces xinghaiensis]RNC70261.1 HAD family hydrolase [Streptomyces xinghaiensis]